MNNIHIVRTACSVCGRLQTLTVRGEMMTWLICGTCISDLKLTNAEREKLSKLIGESAKKQTLKSSADSKSAK